MHAFHIFHRRCDVKSDMYDCTNSTAWLLGAVWLDWSYSPYSALVGAIGEASTIELTEKLANLYLAVLHDQARGAAAVRKTNPGRPWELDGCGGAFAGALQVRQQSLHEIQTTTYVICIFINLESKAFQYQ